MRYGLRTRDRLVRKLRDRLRLEPQVLELALDDDGRFHVRGPLARLGLDLVRAGAAPGASTRAAGNASACADQIGARVVAKHEPHAGGVPPIQVLASG